MLKSMSVSVVVTMILSGCTSMGDHERLKQDVDQLKIALDAYKHEASADRKQFEQAYSPELHDQLNANIKTSDDYVEVIRSALEKIRKYEAEFEKMAKLTQEHYETTNRNAQESQVKNVVNRFKAIEHDWEILQIGLEHKIVQMDKNVLQMENQALLASQNALHAADDARKVTQLYDSVNRLEDELHKMKTKLKKIKNRLDDKQEKSKKPLHSMGDVKSSEHTEFRHN